MVLFHFGRTKKNGNREKERESMMMEEDLMESMERELWGDDSAEPALESEAKSEMDVPAPVDDKDSYQVRKEVVEDKNDERHKLDSPIALPSPTTPPMANSPSDFQGHESSTSMSTISTTKEDEDGTVSATDSNGDGTPDSSSGSELHSGNSSSNSPLTPLIPAAHLPETVMGIGMRKRSFGEHEIDTVEEESLGPVRGDDDSIYKEFLFDGHRNGQSLDIEANESQIHIQTEQDHFLRLPLLVRPLNIRHHSSASYSAFGDTGKTHLTEVTSLKRTARGSSLSAIHHPIPRIQIQRSENASENPRSSIYSSVSSCDGISGGSGSSGSRPNSGSDSVPPRSTASTPGFSATANTFTHHSGNLNTNPSLNSKPSSDALRASLRSSASKSNLSLNGLFSSASAFGGGGFGLGFALGGEFSSGGGGGLSLKSFDMSSTNDLGKGKGKGKEKEKEKKESSSSSSGKGKEKEKEKTRISIWRTRSKEKAKTLTPNPSRPSSPAPKTVPTLPTAAGLMHTRSFSRSQVHSPSTSPITPTTPKSAPVVRSRPPSQTQLKVQAQRLERKQRPLTTDGFNTFLHKRGSFIRSHKNNLTTPEEEEEEEFHCRGDIIEGVGSESEGRKRTARPRRELSGSVSMDDLSMFRSPQVQTRRSMDVQSEYKRVESGRNTSIDRHPHPYAEAANLSDRPESDLWSISAYGFGSLDEDNDGSDYPSSPASSLQESTPRPNSVLRARYALETQTRLQSYPNLSSDGSRSRTPLQTTSGSRIQRSLVEDKLNHTSGVNGNEPDGEMSGIFDCEFWECMDLHLSSTCEDADDGDEDDVAIPDSPTLPLAVFTPSSQTTFPEKKGPNGFESEEDTDPDPDYVPTPKNASDNAFRNLGLPVVEPGTSDSSPKSKPTGKEPLIKLDENLKAMIEFAGRKAQVTRPLMETRWRWDSYDAPLSRFATPNPSPSPRPAPSSGTNLMRSSLAPQLGVRIKGNITPPRPSSASATLLFQISGDSNSKKTKHPKQVSPGHTPTQSPRLSSSPALPLPPPSTLTLASPRSPKCVIPKDLLEAIRASPPIPLGTTGNQAFDSELSTETGEDKTIIRSNGPSFEEDRRVGLVL